MICVQIKEREYLLTFFKIVASKPKIFRFFLLVLDRENKQLWLWEIVFIWCHFLHKPMHGVIRTESLR